MINLTFMQEKKQAEYFWARDKLPARDWAKAYICLNIFDSKPRFQTNPKLVLLIAPS